jgi:hypothetical protein
MFPITVALAVTTVLSFCFASTRRIGLLTIAALAFLFPTVAALCLAIGVCAAAIYYFLGASLNLL